MSFFVTGATGYVGQALVRKLAGSGKNVHALFRSASKTTLLKHSRVSLYRGDILDEKSLEKAMNGCRAVFHAAAKTDIWSKNPDLFYQINVQGTQNVLNCASRLGVDKVVVTSTAGVFGPASSPLDESQGYSSCFFSEYERTKAAADKLAFQFSLKGMHVLVVHPTRIFGPGPLGQSNSVTRMIKSYLEGKWHYVPDRGSARGNYVFIDDVVNGHISAMEKGRSGESYLLGGENATYNQFFSVLKAVSGRKHFMLKIPVSGILTLSYLMLFFAEAFKAPPAVTPAMVRKLNADWMVSSRKAEKELGYSPSPLKEGLKNTIAWIKSLEEDNHALI